MARPVTRPLAFADLFLCTHSYFDLTGRLRTFICILRVIYARYKFDILMNSNPAVTR